MTECNTSHNKDALNLLKELQKKSDKVIDEMILDELPGCDRYHVMGFCPEDIRGISRTCEHDFSYLIAYGVLPDTVMLLGCGICGYAVIIYLPDTIAGGDLVCAKLPHNWPSLIGHLVSAPDRDDWFDLPKSSCDSVHCQSCL